MTKKKAIALILGLLGLLLLALTLVPAVLALLAAESAPAVGIIGGADGPTATMLTRTLFLSFPGGLLRLAGALLGLGCLIAAPIVALRRSHDQ